MTPHEFIKKWKPVALTERQTAQEHFIDLCRLVNHPTPIEDDPSGERYCFEKGALKSSGKPGFADVWKKGYFAFEYKKKWKNLGEALKQLSQYAWNLEHPPLNVVCNTNAIRIVTTWTNTLSKTFDLTLDDLADPEKFAILHAVFHDPEKLRGHMTREMLTKEAADKFSGLAERLQSRGHPPEAVAHFIMQLVFCFFAEDVKLLPEGFFRKALKQLNIGNRHEHAKAMLDDMFCAMATKGGRVGNEFIAYSTAVSSTASPHYRSTKGIWGCSSRSARCNGLRSIRPSSALCSSVFSIRPSGRKLARIIPTPRRFFRSSIPSSCARSKRNGRR